MLTTGRNRRGWKYQQLITFQIKTCRRLPDMQFQPAVRFQVENFKILETSLVTRPNLISDLESCSLYQQDQLNKTLDCGSTSDMNYRPSLKQHFTKLDLSNASNKPHNHASCPCSPSWRANFILMYAWRTSRSNMLRSFQPFHR